MRLKILALLVAAMGMVVYGVMDGWLSSGLGATAAVALLVVALAFIVQTIRSRSSGSSA